MYAAPVMRGFVCFYCLVVFLAICGVSCNAPRNNPLDPGNPDNKLYALQGLVLTDGKNPAVLQDVEVLWNNETLAVTTDAGGSFLLKCDAQMDGWLVFRKQGYSPDSVFVKWGSQKIITLREQLNALPVASDITLYSVVENRYSGPLYHLYFSATVNDPDDDINAVSITCDEFNINKALQSTNKLYSGSLSSYDFLNYNFDDIIGKEFKFIATTANGKSFEVGAAEVKRIINQEIATLSPKNSDTVALPGAVLRWTRFLPGFTFKYKVQIYTDETPAILKWSRENISPDSIAIVVDTTLPSYRYYWTISCVDEFHNESSSKPASIFVK